MYTVGVVTASDKGSKGERVDLSGPLIAELLEAAGYKVLKYVMVADEEKELMHAMIHMADDLKVNLILTTGGTGFSKRDVTPEATLKVIERETPGISEAIRYNSLQITPKGMLSRGVSGIRGDTIIVNMPGSPKAVKETIDYILDPIFHGIQILLGDTSECATPPTS